MSPNRHFFEAAPFGISGLQRFGQRSATDRQFPLRPVQEPGPSSSPPILFTDATVSTTTAAVWPLKAHSASQFNRHRPGGPTKHPRRTAGRFFALFFFCTSDTIRFWTPGGLI